MTIEVVLYGRILQALEYLLPTKTQTPGFLPRSDIFKFRYLPVIKNGGAWPVLGNEISTSQPHDFIAIPFLSKEGILDRATQLYCSGLSLRDIEKETGISKTSIRRTLKLGKVPLRPPAKDSKFWGSGPKAKASGNSPYGFAYLQGQLVRNPTEYQIVFQIQKLWTRGHSPGAIAKVLTARKIHSRSGKPWRRQVIQQILFRLQKSQELPHQ